MALREDVQGALLAYATLCFRASAPPRGARDVRKRKHKETQRASPRRAERALRALVEASREKRRAAAKGKQAMVVVE